MRLTDELEQSQKREGSLQVNHDDDDDDDDDDDIDDDNDDADDDNGDDYNNYVEIEQPSFAPSPGSLFVGALRGRNQNLCCKSIYRFW